MVHLIEQLQRHADWRLLNYMLRNPGKISVNEAAKKARVSKGTASQTLSFLKQAGVLKLEKTGNLKRYSLVDTFLTRELKRLSFLMELDRIDLVSAFLDEDPQIVSLILYGSFAEGSYDDKSDIDLLVVSETNHDFSGLLDKLESRFKREVSLLRYKLSDLPKLQKDDSVFYENLRSNHIILYGAKLP
jgi:hypothetical protein